jgi:major intracellular serine protease
MKTLAVALKHILIIFIAAATIALTGFALLLLSQLFALSANAAEPVRVAVIDTGLDLADPRFQDVLCKSGHKDFTGTGIQDVIGHGTHVAGLIKKYAGTRGYCLIILKFYADGADGQTDMARMSAAEREAVTQGARFVNVSGGGSGFNEDESVILKEARSVTWVVASGNEGKDIDAAGNAYYPACHKLPNIIVVGALLRSGGRASYSNYGKSVTAWELGDEVVSTMPKGQRGRMSGTSMATAIHTGKLIRRAIR